MSFPSDDHRTVFANMSEEEWQLWRHHPTTRAFMNFLEDQRENWRALAADLVEAGAFNSQSPLEDANPNVVRGKLRLLAQLLSLKVEDIQAFYRGERGEEESHG